MRAECVNAVSTAIGRALTQAEAADIEARVRKHLRFAARDLGPAWRGMSQVDRMTEAGQRAAAEIIGEAAKKKQRLALQVLAQRSLAARIGDTIARGDAKTQAGALAEEIRRTDVYIKGVANEYFSKALEAFQLTESRSRVKRLVNLEDPATARAFVMEVFGQDSGVAPAKAAAKVWLETAEAMRVRFNRAGGDIGKLDYGYIPQSHDQVAVLKAGADQWAADTLPKLDRTRYLKEDGTQLTDPELIDVLKGAWETIATGGANKIEPGQFPGSGARANRGSDARVLHFRDAESWIGYQAEFGTRGLFDALHSHVQSLARDIGIVETFGPNANLAFRTLNDAARKADVGAKFADGPLLFVTPDDMWKALTGYTQASVNPRLARVAQVIRDIQVFGKLQGAMISSVTDLGTYYLSAGFHKLPQLTATANLVRAFGADGRAFAQRAEIIGESLVADMNRWSGDHLAHGWSSRLASATMKASLLTAWTDAIRRASAINMMATLGRLHALDWNAMGAGDRVHLERAGFSADDWTRIRSAQLEQWKGLPMLTADAVRAVDPQLATKVLGYVIDETHFASVNPDIYTRAVVTQGTQRGTLGGEVVRSVALFKSFPIAIISRHIRRAVESYRDHEGVSRLAYGAGLATGMTVFGALALQMKALIRGEDPSDMTTAKFWGAALAQGGGLGIYGDFLYAGLGGGSRFDQSLWGTIGGPVVGTAEDLARLTLGNIGQAVRGEDTHAGAEALRLARSNAPFVNMWYARATLDHVFLHDLQEFVSPGYLRKMEGRTRKEWDKGYWWRPGADLDDMRAPDWEGALGR